MEQSKPEPPSDLPAYVAEPLHRQGRDTLEVVRDYVDELLAYYRAREAADIENDELAADDEQLVDVETEQSGTIVVKKVPCGKDCGGCPHGPYKYRVQRHGDSLDWEYLGKCS